MFPFCLRHCAGHPETRSTDCLSGHHSCPSSGPQTAWADAVPQSACSRRSSEYGAPRSEITPLQWEVIKNVTFSSKPLRYVAGWGQHCMEILTPEVLRPHSDLVLGKAALSSEPLGVPDFSLQRLEPPRSPAFISPPTPTPPTQAAQVFGFPGG